VTTTLPENRVATSTGTPGQSCPKLQMPIEVMTLESIFSSV
jgi:hypothetical protein